MRSRRPSAPYTWKFLRISYLKRHFGYRKVRYRGLAKNTERIALLLGFSNLLIAGRYATA